jgi:hypothetical protein
MKIFVVFLLGFLLFSANFVTPYFSTADIVRAEVPPYAKWGQLAMQKTKEKYPNAAITDYLHLGRIPGTTTSTEKFKLWLKDKDKEFGVLVDIEFDKKTERLIVIKFKEVDR